MVPLDSRSAADPRVGFDGAWAQLLASVPAYLRERIQDQSSKINERILRGLPGFKFDSSFDTWRTTVVMRTMASISKVEKRHKNEVPLYIRQRDDDGGEGAEQPLPIEDVAHDPVLLAELAEMWAIVEEVLRITFKADATRGKVISLRLQGHSAAEVEACCGVPEAEVHRIYYLFRRECQRIYRERSA